MGRLDGALHAKGTEVAKKTAAFADFAEDSRVVEAADQAGRDPLLIAVLGADAGLRSAAARSNGGM